MIKRLNSLWGPDEVVNLTGASSDRLLLAGETAVIDFTSATSVPLHIQTVEGLYEIDIMSNTAGTVTNDSAITLSANNTTYSNAFHNFYHGSSSANSHIIGGNSDSSSIILAYSLPYQITSRITTRTASKSSVSEGFTKSTSGKNMVKYICDWDDSTTAWTSLGTVTLPFAQSGKIVVHRVA